jgi:hypothetical protein
MRDAAAHDYLKMLTKILKLAVVIATAFYGVADSFLSLARVRRSCWWDGLRFLARGVPNASRNILLASETMRSDKRGGKPTLGDGACDVCSSDVLLTVVSWHRFGGLIGANSGLTYSGIRFFQGMRASTRRTMVRWASARS